VAIRRIAILGTRGVPGRYGGFETFAEQLSVRLVQRGYDVTVYGRRYFGEPPVPDTVFQGVRVVTTGTFRHKYLDTPVSAITSFVDALVRRRFDAVLLCNAANSPFAFLLRMACDNLSINVDGIERKRAKWNGFGRLWYRLGERCSVIFAKTVVADADVIATYYRERFDSPTVVIPYGVDPRPRPAGAALMEFGLASRRYILYVSRLEPENNALGVIRAYKASGVELPLVIVGDAPYADEYKKQLVAEASGSNIIFTGFQFAERYEEFQSHCAFYIQATEVGGTHPALIEAMSFGNCVIANGTPENREVLADCGLFYEVNDFSELAERMQQCADQPELVNEIGRRARDRAMRSYSWDAVVDAYVKLFEGALVPR
jgi:glycosyltransferase involved in cell wall biosynthesis